MPRPKISIEMPKTDVEKAGVPASASYGAGGGSVDSMIINGDAVSVEHEIGVDAFDGVDSPKNIGQSKKAAKNPKMESIPENSVFVSKADALNATSVNISR